MKLHFHKIDFPRTCSWLRAHFMAQYRVPQCPLLERISPLTITADLTVSATLTSLWFRMRMASYSFIQVNAWAPVGRNCSHMRCVNGGGLWVYRMPWHSQLPFCASVVGQGVNCLLLLRTTLACGHTLCSWLFSTLTTSRKEKLLMGCLMTIKKTLCSVIVFQCKRKKKTVYSHQSWF